MQGFLSRDALNQSAEILKRERDLEDSTEIEFNVRQCSCRLTSLLFAGSFDPDTFVSASNLTITVKINERLRVTLPNQPVQMTDSINIFQYQIPNNLMANPESTTNISVNMSIAGGILLYLDDNNTALVVPAGKLEKLPMLIIANCKFSK